MDLRTSTVVGSQTLRYSPLQRRQSGFCPRVTTLILVIDLLVVATGCPPPPRIRQPRHRR
jgi:hypothetical protein